MNPLDNNAKLFVGNFKVKIDNATALRVDDLVGIQTNGSYITLETVGSKDDPDAYPTYFKPSEVTLIARPIEDMTDEEIMKMSFNKRYPLEEYHTREYLKSAVGDEVMQRDPCNSDFLYLLELGVFPFDQSHFGDTVIDTRTLTNA